MGVHIVGVTPEDSDQLVEYLGGVGRRENGGRLQHPLNVLGAPFIAQVPDHGVGVENRQRGRTLRSRPRLASLSRSAFRACSELGPGPAWAPRSSATVSSGMGRTMA